MTIAQTGPEDYDHNDSYTNTVLTLPLNVPAATDLMTLMATINDFDWTKLTSITVNGTSVGVTQRSTTPAGIANRSARIWTVTSPTAGTYDAVLTFSSLTNNAGGLCASYWSGVDTASPVSAVANSSTGTGTSPQTVSLAVLTGGVIVGATYSDTSQPSPGSGQTVLGTDEQNHSFSYKTSGANYATIFSGTQQIGQAAIALRPASVPPATINLAGSNSNQSATSGTGVATVTPPAAGTVNLAGSNSTGSATSGTGIVGVVPLTGTITSDAFTAFGSPTPLAALTVPHVTVTRMTDAVQVLALTDQVTNGAGKLVLNSASIVTGTWYLLGTWNADGSARGFKAYLAT